MYILNTTFVVDGPAHTPFLELMRERYIPLLRQEGFPEMTFTRLIREEPAGEFTYSLQVAVPTLDDYRRVSEELFSEYERIARHRFGEQVLWFTSLLKKVNC